MWSWVGDEGTEGETTRVGEHLEGDGETQYSRNFQEFLRVILARIPTSEGHTA